MSSLYKSYGSKGMSSTAEGKEDFWTQGSTQRYWIKLQFKAQHKDTAQHLDIKTGRTAPELPLSHQTVDLHKTVNLRQILDIRRIPNIRKIPDIRKILPPLDDHSGTYGVSKAREDKAGRPVLDAEEVTVLPSTSVKA